MEKHIWRIIVPAILMGVLYCCIVFWGKGSMSPEPTEGTDSTCVVSTEAPLTAENIRNVFISDVNADDPLYDVVCYMLYYDAIETVESQFYPKAIATEAMAVEAMRQLGFAVVDSPQPSQPLTRAALAVLLHNNANENKRPVETKQIIEDYHDSEAIPHACREAVCWVKERGLFSSFVGEYFLANTAISRQQLVQALLALCAYEQKDMLAAEIQKNVPDRIDQFLSCDKHEETAAIVNAVAKKYGAVGLQVAVIENGVVADTYAYGWVTKNVDPMTSDHKMRVASISKVAIGITAQILREEGIIDIDADINNYWDFRIQNPQYPNTPITLRHLLTHTSTIRPYDEVATYNSAKKRLVNGNYTSFKPGDINSWLYNNYAFGILGMTLERASGRIVDDILESSLYVYMDIDAAFAAGDLENTDNIVTLYRATGKIARSVNTQKKMHCETTPGVSGTSFCGGLMISAKDLGKMIALLAGKGSYEGLQLLDTTSVKMMETRYSEEYASGKSWQALPMRCMENVYGRDVIYFHTGSAYGVYNCVSYDPETGDGVVVLSVGANGYKDDDGIYKVCAEINRHIYKSIK